VAAPFAAKEHMPAILETAAKGPAAQISFPIPGTIKEIFMTGRV